MLRIIAAVLILLQLRPVAAAAACMVRSQPAAACDMTASPVTDPGRGNAPHHGAAPATPMPSCDCPAVPLCGINTTAVLPTVIRQQLGMAVARPIPQPVRTTLGTADPIAPPVPPPNA